MLRGVSDASDLPVWVKMLKTGAALHFEEGPEINSRSLSLPLSTEFSSTSCSGLLRCTTWDGLLHFLPLEGTFFLTAPLPCFPLVLVGFSDKQVTLLFCLVFLPPWSWRRWGWTVRAGACEDSSNWGETYRECMQTSLTHSMLSTVEFQPVIWTLWDKKQGEVKLIGDICKCPDYR